MSAQSHDFDTSETTMAAAAVDGHTTDSTNSSEEIKLNEILPDKQDGVAAEQVGDEPQYETGWRLGAVMTTIFLTTLLAALDIVSSCSTTIDKLFLTGVTCRALSLQQFQPLPTNSVNSTMLAGMEVLVFS